MLLPLVLGLIPAELARRRGRSFIGFYVFGVVFLPFALAVVLLSREPTHERPGRGASPTTVDD